jgi:predicted aspartyl protease
MINTYRYGGYGALHQDLAAQKIDLPPNDILEMKGAFLQVTITHPGKIQEELIKSGQKVPKLNVSALIDTGAGASVISPRVASELNLIHTGYQKVFSVQDEQEQPVYYGFIIFPWGNGKEIPLVCCPLKGVDCLVGRDILKHWHFTYNGADGSITICD